MLQRRAVRKPESTNALPGRADGRAVALGRVPLLVGTLGWLRGFRRSFGDGRDRHGHTGPAPRSHLFLPYSWASWSERAYPGALESLLFELPCPLRRHRARSIKRPSDKRLLPLTDRQYFQGNRELPEFIPLLLCAMAIVADLPLVHGRIPRAQNADRRRLIERTFRWIERELPGTELPRQVEGLLSDYAWKRLEGVDDLRPGR